MKTLKPSPIQARRAFTLVEMIVAAGVTTVVGLGTFTMLFTSTSLSAKNLALNLTSNQARSAFNRVVMDLSRANSMPDLISTAGVNLAATTAGAPGVEFDQFIGAPYVLVNAGLLPLTTLPANTTSLTLVRSTATLASPDLPKVQDVLLIGGTADTLRPVITALTVNAASGGLQVINATISGLNTAVTAGNALTATIVRPAAYLVMPSGSGFEMRYYSPFSGAPASDPYTVTTNQIGTKTGETSPLPFVLTNAADATITAAGDKPFFVHLNLSVRAGNYDNWLRYKQGDSLNTFARLQTTIHPRVNP